MPCALVLLRRNTKPQVVVPQGTAKIKYSRIAPHPLRNTSSGCEDHKPTNLEQRPHTATKEEVVTHL
jgi:hypothetical protein